MKQLKIRVDRDCINQGNPGYERSCALAIAIRKMGYQNPFVQTDDISFDVGDTTYSYSTTEEIRQFEEDFDALDNLPPEKWNELPEQEFVLMVNDDMWIPEQ
jgi:hypothetical protein